MKRADRRYWCACFIIDGGRSAVLSVVNRRGRRNASLELSLYVYEISNRAGSLMFSAFECRHVLLRPPRGQVWDKKPKLNRNSKGLSFEICPRDERMLLQVSKRGLNEAICPNKPLPKSRSQPLNYARGELLRPNVDLI